MSVYKFPTIHPFTARRFFSTVEVFFVFPPQVSELQYLLVFFPREILYMPHYSYVYRCSIPYNIPVGMSVFSFGRTQLFFSFICFGVQPMYSQCCHLAGGNDDNFPAFCLVPLYRSTNQVDREGGRVSRLPIRPHGQSARDCAGEGCQ
ncbi:Neural-cadherin precursor [Daphnia magna]|uniref:Neural-cadherin n=1 Tax=Daphnia magna TaxID=35525 RepID=A0A164WJN7_9CRUS|nr:Neural-cadherin precursor [Daphnia magna]